ncbi:MAG: serine/threonine protein kinase, partial [Planctomycetota bacterium]
EEGIHYFAMEYIDGDNLSTIIKNGKRFSEEECINITIQACRGLEEANKFDIIHRDIKPSNIMVTKDGVVKIADFGLAKSLQETRNLTQTDVFMGTVNYTSPEQGLGKKLDQRTDIYSLGIVLYQLLTNKLPFESDSAAGVIYMHIHTKPQKPKTINPDISSQIEQVVSKAIAKKPEDRYQTMKDFREALQALAHLKSKKITHKAKSYSFVKIAAPILFVVVGVLLYFLLSSPSENKQVASLKRLITEVTDINGVEEINNRYQQLKKKYPNSMQVKLIAEKMVRVNEMMDSANLIIEDIKSRECINDIRYKKENINFFARKYPEFEKKYVSLNILLESKKNELVNLAEKDFKRAKDSINKAKTSKDINTIQDVFKNNICDNYREYWFGVLKGLWEGRMDELVFNEAVTMLSKASTVEEVERVGSKYKNLLQIGGFKGLIDNKVKEKIERIEILSAGEYESILTKINQAEDLQELDLIKDSIDKFSQANKESPYVSTLRGK